MLVEQAFHILGSVPLHHITSQSLLAVGSHFSEQAQK